MVRLIHIISAGNIGGAGVLLCNLLKYTDSSRYQVSVILPRGSLLISRLRALQVPYDEVDYLYNRSFDPRAVLKIITVLRREKPTIVHTHAALSGRVASLLCKVPIRIMTRHCAFPPSGILSHFPGKQVNGWIQSRLFGHCIAVADAAKKNLLEVGIPEERIHVVINGSESVHPVSELELENLRNQLGLSAECFIIGICARLEPYKDHVTFLKMARICLDVSPELRFLIIGGGSQEPILREMVRSLNMEKQVIFTGFVKDPAPYYRLLSVNVNCSVGTETSCLAVSEGYSIGLPAVVSDFGGNPAMVEEGVSGFVVPQARADLFAEKILELYRNPEQYHWMCKKALERYKKKYTASVMTTQTEAVYESLLRKSTYKS